MRTFLKLILVLAFGILIFFQIKSFATKQLKLQCLLTQREIQSLELELKFSQAVNSKDIPILTNKLTTLYTKIIEDPKSTRNEKIKAKESLAFLKLTNRQIQEAYNLALEALTEQPRLHMASGVLFGVIENKANEYLKQLRYDEAILECQNLLKIPLSENYQALTEARIAHLYRSSGDRQTAITLYQDLIGNHPYLPNWRSFAQYRILRIYYYHLGNMPKAKEELDKLFSLYPYSPWSKMAKYEFEDLTK